MLVRQAGSNISRSSTRQPTYGLARARVPVVRRLYMLRPGRENDSNFGKCIYM